MSKYQFIFEFLESSQMHELPNAFGYGHDPKIASMYYKYIFYEPLEDNKLSTFLQSCQFNVSEHLIDFYNFCNGLEFGQRLSIFGSLLSPGLKPISLEYGNFYERPQGLPNTSTVIGGMELSDDINGYVIVHENGTVTCTSSFLKCDIVKQWANIETFLRDELETSKFGKPMSS